MRTVPLSLLATLLAVVPATAEPHVEPARDIVETAVAAGSFETLVTAVEHAGLVDALKGEGPFTVFAPTDEAFAKLPADTVADLLRPENKARLKRVLTYHVVEGLVRKTDLLRSNTAGTLSGAPVTFGLRVGDANIVKADIACSNGVIHVIDSVLLPPAPKAKRVAARSASSILEQAIARGVPMFNQGNPDGCAEVYTAAAREVLALDARHLGPLDRRDLEHALAKRADSGRERAWNLRHAFDRVLDNASFEPLMEASMPPGFPEPGPVGRVVVKKYPRYRAARAEGSNSFWTLFQHIKKNKVEMTAPVEMTMDADMRTRDMAFLYEGPKQGQAGRQGRVDVLDLEPITVLSIGMRGRRTSESLEMAKSALEEALKADGWSQAGDYRALGYNSPMVPNSRRFWELQVPVRRSP